MARATSSGSASIRANFKLAVVCGGSSAVDATSALFWDGDAIDCAVSNGVLMPFVRNQFPALSDARAGELDSRRGYGRSRLNGLYNFRRKPKPDVFRHDFHLIDRPEAVIPQVVDHAFGQNFRRRCAR